MVRANLGVDMTRETVQGKRWDDKWAFRDAEWWQFWMPQSGLAGGMIAGVVVIVAIVALFAVVIS